MIGGSASLATCLHKPHKFVMNSNVNMAYAVFHFWKAKVGGAQIRRRRNGVDGVAAERCIGHLHMHKVKKMLPSRKFARGLAAEAQLAAPEARLQMSKSSYRGRGLIHEFQKTAPPKKDAAVVFGSRRKTASFH